MPLTGIRAHTRLRVATFHHRAVAEILVTLQRRAAIGDRSQPRDVGIQAAGVVVGDDPAVRIRDRREPIVVGRTRRSERPSVLYLRRSARIDSTAHRLPFREQAAQAIELALDLIDHAATSCAS